CRLAPLALEVLPEVETANLGANFSAAQLVTWKELSTAELAPSVLAIAPVMLSLLQLVGLKVKPGRSIVTLTCFICSGMPSRMWGIGSVVTVRAAVRGSTSIF